MIANYQHFLHVQVQPPDENLFPTGARRERRRVHPRGDSPELAGSRGRHPGGGGPLALLLPQELLREQGLDADGARREVGREQVQPGGEGEDDENDARVLRKMDRRTRKTFQGGGARREMMSSQDDEREKK